MINKFPFYLIFAFCWPDEYTYIHLFLSLARDAPKTTKKPAKNTFNKCSNEKN